MEKEIEEALLYVEEEVGQGLPEIAKKTPEQPDYKFGDLPSVSSP